MLGVPGSVGLPPEICVVVISHPVVLVGVLQAADVTMRVEVRMLVRTVVTVSTWRDVSFTVCVVVAVLRLVKVVICVRTVVDVAVKGTVAVFWMVWVTTAVDVVVTGTVAVIRTVCVTTAVPAACVWVTTEVW